MALETTFDAVFERAPYFSGFAKFYFSFSWVNVYIYEKGIDFNPNGKFGEEVFFNTSCLVIRFTNGPSKFVILDMSSIYPEKLCLFICSTTTWLEDPSINSNT